MINLPYPEIVKKLIEKKGISEAEIEEKVNQKMEQLSGLISKEGAAYIVANDMGVQLVDTSDGPKKIKDIFPGMKAVEVVGKVARKFPVNEFERNGNKGKVGSFIIADETGELRITAWHEMVTVMDQFDQGDIVKIESGYAKENNMNKNTEIHLNNNSKLLVNPEGVKVDVEISASAQPSSAPQQVTRKNISELQENDFNAEVFATVVQVFDPRFYPTCPQCNKKVTQSGDSYSCAEHGTVTPKYGYVMNIFLDDGTDNIRAVFFRDNVLQLIGKSDEEMQKYREEPEKFEEIKTNLLGETIKVVGRVVKNSMFDRLEIMANKVEVNVDPSKEIGNVSGSSKDASDSVKPAEQTSETKSDKPEVEAKEPSEKSEENIPSIDDL